MTARATYGHNSAEHVADDFDQMIRDAIRQMRRSCDGLDRRQAKLLEDFGSHGRYVQGLRQVLEIARSQVQRPEDALAIVEQLRGFILSGHVIDLTIPEASLRETEANGAGDLAQHRHAYFATAGTRADVIETMRAQEFASRALADTMWRHRPTLVTSGLSVR